VDKYWWLNLIQKNENNEQLQIGKTGNKNTNNDNYKFS